MGRGRRLADAAAAQVRGPAHLRHEERDGSMTGTQGGVTQGVQALRELVGAHKVGACAMVVQVDRNAVGVVEQSLSDRLPHPGPVGQVVPGRAGQHGKPGLHRLQLRVRGPHQVDVAFRIAQVRPAGQVPLVPHFQPAHERRL